MSEINSSNILGENEIPEDGEAQGFGIEDEFVDADDEISWLYNQELKVTKEDIPVVLTELTDAAVSYIKKDDFEKALILL